MRYLLTCLLVLGLSSACWAGEALVKRSQSTLYGPCNPLLEEIGICVSQQVQKSEGNDRVSLVGFGTWKVGKGEKSSSSNFPSKYGDWAWDFGKAD